MAAVLNPRQQLVKADCPAQPAGQLSGKTIALCLSLAAIVAMLPSFINGIPDGADLTNHFRFALPFADALRHGHGTGWLADSNAGWGDPRFRFYPPGLYYLLAVLRLVCGSWYAATLATFTLITLARGAGVYLWARELALPRQNALLAGLAAIFAPYLLVEYYQASLLAEYLACSVLPFSFAFAGRLVSRARVGDIAGLAASYALLLYSHLPLAVIGSLALLAYSLLRLKSGWRWRAVAFLAAGAIIGLAAAASFWVTMLAELPLIKSGGIAPKPYYDYRNNFLFSPFALTHLNTWLAGLFGFATVAYVSPAIAFRRRLEPGNLPALSAVFWLLAGAFVMTTDLSRPVWFIVPKLSEIQFPFRWLSVVSLCGAVLLGACASAWFRQWRQLPALYALAVIGFALALGIIAHQVYLTANYMPREKFEAHIADARSGPSFQDWLPVKAKEVKEMPPMKAPVEAAGRTVNILSWEPQRRVFTVSAGNAGAARVKTYYYPRWQASNEAGQPAAVSPDENGALLVNLPTEATTVTLSFTEPPRTAWSRALTVAGWFVIALLFLYGRRETRHPAPS
jgi:hypothetical protein